MTKHTIFKALRALLPYGVIALAALAAVFLLFSNVFTRPDARLYPATNLPAAAWSDVSEQPVLADSAPGLIAGNAPVTLHVALPKTPAKTLTLTFASDSALPMYLAGSVEMRDTTCAPEYRTAASFAATPNGTHRTVTVPLTSTDGVTDVRIKLRATSDAYLFVGGSVNAPQPLRLAWGKWLVLFCLVSLAYTVRVRKWYALEYSATNKKHAALLAGTMVLCLAFAGVVAAMGGGAEGYGKPYVSGEVAVTHEQYAMQFDAWQHGSFALLAQPDEALLALDNPYSIGARYAAGAPYLHDSVLYEGKYYSYYGVAPLLCVYLPFYALTGSLPTGITVCTVFVLLAIVGIYGALRELLRAFAVRANLLLLLLGAPAVVCGSMLYFNQSCLLVYYIPLLSALAFLAWFICFAFRAARAQPQILRAVRFILAAVCLALCVASRPNVAVFCVAFAAPLFLGVLVNKQRPLAHRAVDMAAFAVPALILCMAVLWYNYARFGSLAEFGSTYNLTNNDIRFNVLEFTPARFFDMLYNCFLLPFQTSTTFPFVQLGAGSTADYGRWYYSASCTFGVFAMPLAWAVCLAPKTLRRTQPVKSATYVLVACTALFIAYVNCCVGGLIERYTCDILLPLLLLALPILLEVFRAGGSVRVGGWLYTAACLALCVTIAFGVLTVFADHPDLTTNIKDYAPNAYLTARQWLS